MRTLTVGSEPQYLFTPDKVFVFIEYICLNTVLGSNLVYILAVKGAVLVIIIVIDLKAYKTFGTLDPCQDLEKPES